MPPILCPSSLPCVTKSCNIESQGLIQSTTWLAIEGTAVCLSQPGLLTLNSAQWVGGEWNRAWLLSSGTLFFVLPNLTVVILYYSVTHRHRFSGLKQECIISVSVGQESRYGLNGFSAQVLTWLKSRCQTRLQFQPTSSFKFPGH